MKTKKVTKSKLNFRRKRQAFFETAEIVRYHSYRIEYKRGWHEIVCPRYRLADGSDVIVIPWYLIPGRPYPIQIYLYACGLYSSNPDIGQRGAAKATRKKFGLEKFSHSTVSRTFGAIEESRKEELERRFGEELKVCAAGGPDLASAPPKCGTRSREAPKAARRFPTAADTSGRRKEMAGFLAGFHNACKEMNIEAAGRQFVKDWNRKARRLLL